MKRLIFAGVIALGLAFSGSAIAADGAALFKSKCAPCHGPQGGGTAMGPAFTGNAWLKGAPEAEVIDTIKNGREGAKKKYKNIALGMPKQNLNDADLKAVAEFIKGLAK